MRLKPMNTLFYSDNSTKQSDSQGAGKEQENSLLVDDRQAASLIDFAYDK